MVTVAVLSVAAQQPVPPAPMPGAAAAQPVPAPPPPLVAVRPIKAPAKPLPSEKESAGVTQFAFIAYGDTRSASQPDVPGDGQIIHPDHSRLVEQMIAKAREAANTPFPIRFAVQTGDAVLRGMNGTMWNVSFTPIIDRLSDANIPYFFAVGNHDVTGMPGGDRGRAQGLHNVLTAMSNLIPSEGSPRRLNGYATYSFGYGNAFFLMIDSNIASDSLQLSWVTDQLEHLDRNRYMHVVAVFHHPVFSSGPHGGKTIEPATQSLRTAYMPLFRKHRVRLLLTGHDHFLDHFVERYADLEGKSYRMDAVITGGGGAPIYLYDSEPDLAHYIAAGKAENVRVEHIMRPGPTAADNPHHFIIIRVDGAQLSVEAVALGGQPYAPYAGKARIDLND